MSDVTTIAVQRARRASRSGAGGTVSDQRRAAEFRIDLRRARILTLVSRRLTAGRSLLGVDGLAASRPLDSSRPKDSVPGMTGSHGRGGSVASARGVGERGHEGPLDAQRGVGS